MTFAKKEVSRRRFLTGVIGGAAAAALLPKGIFASSGKAKIIRVESDHLWNGDSRDPKVIADMLNKGLLALTGEKSAQDAWKFFFKPGMRVGLKINLLGRPFLYTAKDFTEAVADGVINAGVMPADVFVWDRFKDHFAPTKYVLGPGHKGINIIAGGEYDSTRVAKCSAGNAPMDKIPLERTHVTVSLPLLKDHGGAGVTLALKNIAFGCYKHHGSAHDNNCDPYVPEAYKHFIANAKLPLIILDATEACYEGGPQPRDRNRIWKENAIYFATDPVALDVVCREVVQKKRVASGLSDLTRKCHHIETAAGMGLGVGDKSNIELITLKV